MLHACTVSPPVTALRGDSKGGVTIKGVIIWACNLYVDISRWTITGVAGAVAVL